MLGSDAHFSLFLHVLREENGPIDLSLFLEFRSDVEQQILSNKLISGVQPLFQPVFLE